MACPVKPRNAKGQFTSGAGGESDAVAAGRRVHQNYGTALGADGDYVLNQRMPGSLDRPSGGVQGPRVTEAGLAQSFDRHAAQWFGGVPQKATHMAEWQGVIGKVAGRSKIASWSSGNRSTSAHLARIDGKYFVAQFDRASGDLVTAFSPNSAQLGRRCEEIGRGDVGTRPVGNG